MLKMWKLSNLSHKRHLQEVVFPNGVVWSKENDDIEPLSKNEFLFTFGLKSSDYAKKKKDKPSKMKICPLWLPLLDLNQRPSD